MITAPTGSERRTSISRGISDGPTDCLFRSQVWLGEELFHNWLKFSFSVSCLPRTKLEWFPGWQQNENYNRQPNDDGLSKQDCVEIRRHFNRPSLSSSATSLTESFMWNDRDCATENSFLCERALIDGRLIYYFGFCPS
jgi:hypothetical protein